MDWFFALDTPAQVALIGVLSALVAAGGGVLVAVVNKRRGGNGGRTAELAAVTIDSTAVKQVAAAVEALNMTMKEQSRDTKSRNHVVENLINQVIRELSELREELRRQGEAMRRP